MKRREGKYLGNDREAGKGRERAAGGGTEAPRELGAALPRSAPRSPAPGPVGRKSSSTGRCACSQTQGPDRPRAAQNELGAGGSRVPTLRAVTSTSSVLATALHSHTIIYLVLFSKWTHFLLSSDLDNENP